MFLLSISAAAFPSCVLSSYVLTNNCSILFSSTFIIYFFIVLIKNSLKVSLCRYTFFIKKKVYIIYLITIESLVLTMDNINRHKIFLLLFVFKHKITI